MRVGASHYPLIVAVHFWWLALLWWLAPGRPIVGLWLAVFVLLEMTRLWVLRSLGSTLDHARSSFCQALPWSAAARIVSSIIRTTSWSLAKLRCCRWFGLWPIALIFTILNALVLLIRIREENKAVSRG